MKFWDLTIITFALSIVGIILSTLILGQKYFDFNVWNALMIYTIPAMILSCVNGLTLISAQKLIKKTAVRFGIGLIPIFILVSLLLWSKGPSKYISEFGLIPIIITYLIWILRD